MRMLSGDLFGRSGVLRNFLFLRQYWLFALERIAVGCTKCSQHPQVFIFGLPRSGTTLVYQYIVHRLNVAYFTNGVGKFPMAPCVITFLQSRFHGRYRSDFKSKFGKVSGPMAPREAGGFWLRYFSLDAYERFEDMAARDVKQIRRTIGCVQKVFDDAPFVNKNVKHLLRLHALNRLFPESLFIIVERQLKDVALSLLRARHEILDDPERWWSVKPPNFPELSDCPIVEQILGQCLGLKEKMEADLLTVPDQRIIRISFKDFCENPEILIAQLKNYFGEIPQKNPAIDSFEFSSNTPESPLEYELVKRLENGLCL